jgi:hypothetical protein
MKLVLLTILTWTFLQYRRRRLCTAHNNDQSVETCKYELLFNRLVLYPEKYCLLVFRTEVIDFTGYSVTTLIDQFHNGFSNDPVLSYKTPDFIDITPCRYREFYYTKMKLLTSHFSRKPSYAFLAQQFISTHNHTYDRENKWQIWQQSLAESLLATVPALYSEIADIIVDYTGCPEFAPYLILRWSNASKSSEPCRYLFLETVSPSPSTNQHKNTQEHLVKLTYIA